MLGQKAAIAKHLKNIFVSGELIEDAVVSILETTAADGKNYPTRYYNLDAAIDLKSPLELTISDTTKRTGCFH